jgi:nitroreductase
MTTLSSDLPVAPEALPAGAGVAQRLRAAVAMAVLAPSVHNTQPWRFRLVGESLELRADRSRTLPAADPQGRLLVVSCGTALLTLEIAARHYGVEPAVELLPDPADPDLLARITTSGPAQSDDPRLFAAIAFRRTNRRGFASRDLPDSLLRAIIRDAVADGAWAYAVTAVADRWLIGSLVEAGDRELFADPAFRQELTSWMRSHRDAAHDGMHGYAAGAYDPVAHLRPLLRSLDVGRSTGSRDRSRTETSPAIVIVGTAGDTERDWLVAGRALQRMLLTVTGAGVAAAFVNQAVQVPALRERLARLVPYDGVPQVAVRLGYPLASAPAEPRRGADEVLDVATALPRQRDAAD